MLQTVQKEWQAIWGRTPGERFQGSYWKSHQTVSEARRASRIVRIVAAAGAFLVGVCFIFLPLPEFPFFLIAGALLAAESLPFAQFLDRGEMRARTFWTKVQLRYRLGPLACRGIVLVFSIGTLACSGAAFHALRF